MRIDENGYLVTEEVNTTWCLGCINQTKYKVNTDTGLLEKVD